jgi:hypothetical protein
MSTATPITDHDQIRRWAEENNGRPARVKGTGQGGDPGILRLDFDEKDDNLEAISWDEWFKWFDQNDLALLCSADSRFNKLVNRH